MEEFTKKNLKVLIEENIELIDGEKFIELLDTYGIIVNKHVVDKSECFLTEDDF